MLPRRRDAKHCWDIASLHFNKGEATTYLQILQSSDFLLSFLERWIVLYLADWLFGKFGIWLLASSESSGRSCWQGVGADSNKECRVSSGLSIKYRQLRSKKTCQQ